MEIRKQLPEMKTTEREDHNEDENRNENESEEPEPRRETRLEEI